jgi:hypothetical protein
MSVCKPPLSHTLFFLFLSTLKFWACTLGDTMKKDLFLFYYNNSSILLRWRSRNLYFNFCFSLWDRCVRALRACTRLHMGGVGGCVWRGWQEYELMTEVFLINTLGMYIPTNQYCNIGIFLGLLQLIKIIIWLNKKNQKNVGLPSVVNSMR